MMSVFSRQRKGVAAVFVQHAVISALLCECDFMSGSHRLEAAERVQTAVSPEIQSAAKKPAKIALCLGQTEAEVQQLLGKPDGKMTSAHRTVLLYSGESLEFINGKLTNPKPDISERIKANKAAEAKRAAQEKVLAKKSKPAPSVKSFFSLINNTGNTEVEPAAAPVSQTVIDEYSDLIVPGKITVVDFYATWCGPCRRMAPILDDMVRGESDVTLLKVDIGDWGSDVAKKYNITSVPNVRVFDAAGRMIGSPTSSPKQVAQNIERAKRSQ